MALNIKKAQAATATTKFQAFNGALLLVVPMENTLSQFKRKNPETGEETDQYQTHSLVVPLEEGSARLDNGTKVEFTAGEVHRVYFDGAIRKFLNELEVPVVGRLGKGKPGKLGGKPWVFHTPTDDDMDVVADFEGLEEKVEAAMSDFNSRKAQRVEQTSASNEDEETTEVGATTPPWKKQ